MLIAFRALQGVAGALLTPSSLAVIVATFPRARARPGDRCVDGTVAPLTAAILAGIDQTEAGIGSAVNNAVARVAGLIATVAIGAIVAAQFSSSLDHISPANRSLHAIEQPSHKPNS
jgi:MFS family permease